MITNKIKGVLLDVDGTLVDSNHQHTLSWQQALKEAGFAVPYARIRSLIGMGGDKLLPQLTGVSEESKQGKEISKRRGEIFRVQYVDHLKPFPGVRELLERMKQEGLGLAIATSAPKEDLKKLLKVAGIEDLIDEKTSSSDADNSKPDPDIIEQALNKIHCMPEEALMLGDTPYDVEAAQRSGVRTVALRCGGWDDEGLQGALEIYKDPEELLASFQSSSFCRAVAVPARDSASPDADSSV